MPEQTAETMEEITVKFRERVLLIPKYVTVNEVKKKRYHDMLRVEIREFINALRYQMLENMTD